MSYADLNSIVWMSSEKRQRCFNGSKKSLCRREAVASDVIGEID
jgi:hypothetical protein